jgi:hypothetical protein
MNLPTPMEAQALSGWVKIGEVRDLFNRLTNDEVN